MARTAFLSDFFLKKAGLSGKSMFPLLTGFGCTVPAVYAAKYSGSVKEANRTLSALMFVPCCAKLPLSLLVCENIFPGFEKSAVIFSF